MLNSETIGYNFFNLQPLAIFNRLYKGVLGKVSDTDKKALNVTMGETIYGKAIYPEYGFRPVAGSIFVAHYVDGKEREIFVPVDQPHENFCWDKAVFLKEGRKTNDEFELVKVRIPKLNEPVSSSLIDLMKKEKTAHDAEIRAAIKNNVKPVRNVTMGERISGGALCAPAGRIYKAHYIDDTEREIFVPLNENDGTPCWNDAAFVKECRKTNHEFEIRKLSIPNWRESVPASLIDLMKKELAAYNAVIIAAADLRYG